MRPHHLPLSADEHTSSQAVQGLRLFYRRFSGGCHYADTLLQRKEPGAREKAMSLLDESLAISSELGMRPLMERVLSRREILRA